MGMYLGNESAECPYRHTCGDYLVVEHNGDVYSCDHFVEPNYYLGNIIKKPIGELVSSEKQRDFGSAKWRQLPQYCKKCEYLFTCYGECPKNRVLKTPDGEEGLNWLCEGLKAFFIHTRTPMQIMANLLRNGQPASDIMSLFTQ
jgi:uncharacterized protein